MKRVYRKTSNAMAAHMCLIPKDRRPNVVYARFRANHAVHPLYFERIYNPTHTKLVEAESRPDFVSFFIYE